MVKDNKNNNEEISEEIQRIIEKQLNKNKEVCKKDVDEVPESIDKNINESAEVVPLGTNIMVSPYKTNPYAKLKIENGVIVSNDSPHKVKNQDTGELEEAEQFIIVAKVQEIGPDVKNVIVGDDVYYTKPSATPLPFLQLGMFVVPEQRILAVVNTKVKERWNK